MTTPRLAALAAAVLFPSALAALPPAADVARAGMVDSAVEASGRPSPGPAREHLPTPGVDEPGRTAGARVSVRRIDLARAWQRFERAALDADPQGPALADLNRRVDALAMLFLGGRFGEALEQVDALTADVMGLKGEARETWLAAAGVRVIAERSWIVSAGDAPVRLRVERMYGGGAPASVHLRLSSLVKAEAWEWPVSLEAKGSSGRVEVEADELVPGQMDLWIVSADGAAFRAGQMWVLDGGTAASAREALTERIESSGLARHRREDMLAVVEQMTGEDDSLTWLVDSPPGVLHEWERRFGRFARGRQGERPMPGHHRGIVRLGEVRVPVLVFAPNQIMQQEPLPLVIALHGAGGDENMWIDGYGAGLITDLAREKGFIVASPLAYPVLGNGAMLEALIDDVAADFSIDRSRVYLIGHSMGGMGTSALAEARPDLLAACCAIAGASNLRPGAARAPMLVYGAEHDRIVPAGRIERQVSAAVQAGEAVTYRLVPHQGHTLVVPGVLREAVEWLLEHRLE